MGISAFILRNASHKLQPDLSAFDDFTVEVLLSLYISFHEEYVLNRSRLARAICEEVVLDLELLGQHYTPDKKSLGINSPPTNTKEVIC